MTDMTPAENTDNLQDDAIAIVRMRNDFYRDNYRRVVGALLMMVAIIAATTIQPPKSLDG